ncbi:MAG: carbohydrate kinase [Alphaproteobacteria bacterium]|nr:carbohydrate kinase [Alphaproteobacteria bacterium]
MLDAGSLYVGIDLGTSQCRACVIDASGLRIAFASHPLPPPTRRDGRIEQAPEIWWSATHKVLHDILPRIDRRHVRAIAVDGTSGTILLVDRVGVPLGPALMYSDQSSRAEADRVRLAAPGDSPAFGASSSLSKLLQLLARDRFARPDRALHQADWIAGGLMGRFDFGDENNALKLGYDPVMRAWPTWLFTLGIAPGLLPRIVPAGTSMGPISPAQAREFDLAADTRIVAGTTDGVAAAIAAGAIAPGDAVTSLGSTLVLKILVANPIISAAHGVYTHRLGDLWLAGGASNSGGAALATVFSADEIDRLSAQIDPAWASPHDYYPLPSMGERFPTNDPHLQPRLEPRPPAPAEFLHGLLESIARIEHAGYRLLESLGAPYPRHVLTSGGGARNRVWQRIRERVLGVSVRAAVETEPAFGAALLARRGGA